MKRRLQWGRVAMTAALALALVAVTLFVLWNNAYAGVFTGGPGNCGNFADAIKLAKDGDVVVQMVAERDSGGAVITQNLRLSGGWAPTQNCEVTNQYFTTTADYLDYGFEYLAPFTRTTLVHDGAAPVLTVDDPDHPTFPNVDRLVVENFILHKGDPLPTDGGGIGGVISDSASMLLDNVWFLNSAAGNRGGGLFMEEWFSSTLHLQDNRFFQNTAGSGGGGLYARLREGSRLVVEDTVFEGNRSLFGGAMEVHVLSGSELVIRDSVFDNNGTSSVNGYGGAAQIFVSGGRVVVENSTFVGNYAGNNEGNGGALFIRLDGGSVVVKNSTFSNNTAGQYGGAIYVQNVGNSPGTVQLINNRFENNSPDDHHFVQSGNGTFTTNIFDEVVHLPIASNNWPFDARSAQIHSISLDENNNYVVDFDAYNYEPALPGEHVHFFFDTVAPEDAGTPGSGPWKLYGGPSPFTGYAFADRPFGPYGAEQMCILVANPDHSVLLNSGNCVKLP